MLGPTLIRNCFLWCSQKLPRKMTGACHLHWDGSACRNGFKSVKQSDRGLTQHYVTKVVYWKSRQSPLYNEKSKIQRRHTYHSNFFSKQIMFWALLRNLSQIFILKMPFVDPWKVALYRLYSSNRQTLMPAKCFIRIIDL